ncbi:MAG: hypothetical protein JWN33_139 [Candidatus Saccharibacteria bacterium]|nr:hypothetical protein [Candidatus Saccharibacteria bacterium]
MKQNIVQTTIISLIAVLALSFIALMVISSQSVLAKDGSDSTEVEDNTSGSGSSGTSGSGKAEGSSNSGKSVETTVRQKAEDSQQLSEDRVTTQRVRLGEAKLKICQNREQNIQGIITRITDRGTKQLAVFDKISDRVQLFYTTKGNIWSGYDAQVDKVAAKRAAATAAIDSVKSTSTEFTCDGDNPKGVADSFKQQLRSVKAALKEYKTALKDLIVGVKSVQPDDTAETTEGSQAQ